MEICTSAPGTPSWRLQFADHPPHHIHLQLHRAGAAAQQAVVVALDSRPPHADAGQHQQRIVVAIRLCGRGDKADNMGQMLSLGIDAGRANIDADAWQIRGVELDRRHLLPGEEFAHQHGNEASPAAHFALDPRPFGL